MEIPQTIVLRKQNGRVHYLETTHVLYSQGGTRPRREPSGYKVDIRQETTDFDFASQHTAVEDGITEHAIALDQSVD